MRQKGVEFDPEEGGGGRWKMKRKIELTMEIDLEEIAKESGSRRDAFNLLNKQLGKEREDLKEEFKSKFEESRTAFKLGLENELSGSANTQR